jgi:TPP-dependent trihydroxycyclohexane-1,2-dione (THcHDO) dehydratase
LKHIRGDILDRVRKEQIGFMGAVERAHKEARVPAYESWWDVPVAEVSEMSSVREVRGEYEKAALGKEELFVSGHKN